MGMQKAHESLPHEAGGMRMWLHDQWSIDRTGVTPPSRQSWGDRVAAYAVIAVVFVAGWGRGTVTALQILLGTVPVPRTRAPLTVMRIATETICRVVISLVAGGVILWIRWRTESPKPHVRWRTSAKAFAATYCFVIAGSILMAIVSAIFNLQKNSFSQPPIHGALLAWHVAVNGMAGPSEELALLALVVVSLRVTEHPWPVVMVVAVLVRVPFHLYYGWGALALAVWPVLMVMLYKRTGAIAAIILAHASFDMVTFIPGDASSGLIQAAVALVGLVVVLIPVWNADKPHRPGVNSAEELQVVNRDVDGTSGPAR